MKRRFRTLHGDGRDISDAHHIMKIGNAYALAYLSTYWDERPAKRASSHVPSLGERGGWLGAAVQCAKILRWIPVRFAMLSAMFIEKNFSSSSDESDMAVRNVFLMISILVLEGQKGSEREYFLYWAAVPPNFSNLVHNVDLDVEESKPIFCGVSPYKLYMYTRTGDSLVRSKCPPRFEWSTV